MGDDDPLNLGVDDVVIGPDKLVAVVVALGLEKHMYEGASHGREADSRDIPDLTNDIAHAMYAQFGQLGVRANVQHIAGVSRVGLHAEVEGSDSVGQEFAQSVVGVFTNGVDVDPALGPDLEVHPVADNSLICDVTDTVKGAEAIDNPGGIIYQLFWLNEEHVAVDADHFDILCKCGGHVDPSVGGYSLDAS